jgi:hypothetical protein
VPSRLIVLVATTAVSALTACGSERPTITSADYLTELEAICDATTATIDALPEPPEQISVADFATSAADALDNEAEQARELDVPPELAADHRAFVRNTDDQATAWRSIAADLDEIDASSTRIGELVRGRNDLVDEMGASRCRRGDV